MMIPVTKTFLPDLSSYKTYLDRIWSSGHITNNGALVNDLSRALGNFLGTSDVELVCNGTLALQVAIKSLNLTGEIITTPYSYVATTNSILWEGIIPVFVDIEKETFCIDTDLVEDAITDKTTAILATHVYGYPCNLKRIEQIAKKHNLKVIYDAAHAFGVSVNGESILNFGDCSALSFHATKLFHTAEGGGLVTRNNILSEKIRLMSKFGHLGEDNYLCLGINAKMSELNAAMGLAVLPHVPGLIKKRRDISNCYDEYLSLSSISRPLLRSGVEYNYAYYPVVFESNSKMLEVRERLNFHGIYPRRYFYPSLNKLPFLDDMLKKSCPVSESIADRVLCLPLYSEMTLEEVYRISKIVLEVTM